MRLEDFSSDVEVPADGLSDLEDDAECVHIFFPHNSSMTHCYLSSRFEEVDDEEEAAAANKKRPRESDANEEDEDASKKSSKAEKKKTKKMKGQDGSAVEAPASAAAPKEKGKEKEKPKEKKESAGEVKTLSAGTKVKDVVVGKGQQAKKGNILQIRYIGKLDNGKVFDSNTKGKPVCRFSSLFLFLRLLSRATPYLV
jgi:FK506-binding nuclear protein